MFLPGIIAVFRPLDYIDTSAGPYVKSLVKCLERNSSAARSESQAGNRVASIKISRLPKTKDINLSAIGLFYS